MDICLTCDLCPFASEPKEPDFSDISNPKYDWTYTVYGKVKELLPKDGPEPLGKYVTLFHYIDANHIHDITSGK
jgi:hypothetical protein